MRWSTMDQTEIRQRLKEDLGIPRFEGKLEDKEYTEEEYQKLKADLLQYFKDYIHDTEH